MKKKDALVEKKLEEGKVANEETIEKVNALVEDRVEELKKEIPEVLDYAKLKKLEECVNNIKEAVGYKSDEQVEKVTSESARMLHSTKTLIETQAKTISEKTASLGESAKKIRELNEKIQKMQVTLEAKDKQIVESVNKAKDLNSIVQNLQKKVEESKKINESIEEKRKNESLKYYLESKIAQYPKYEAALLRKHF